MFVALPGRAAGDHEIHHELANTTWRVLTLESGIAVAVFGTFFLATEPPSTCRWCATNGFDDGIRSALRASDPRVAGTASHVFSIAAVPLVGAAGLVLPALGDHELGRAGKDVWIVANTTVFTIGLTLAVKVSAARQRPAFHYGVQTETEAANTPREANLSFFSSDTAAAFSVAACSTTLAYLHGYESAPWILAGGAAFATTAGVLRISADMHWATDVMMGALVGTAAGVSVPLLLHERRSNTDGALSFNVMVSPHGVSVFGAF